MCHRAHFNSVQHQLFECSGEDVGTVVGVQYQLMTIITNSFIISNMNARRLPQNFSVCTISTNGLSGAHHNFNASEL